MDELSFFEKDEKKKTRYFILYISQKRNKDEKKNRKGYFPDAFPQRSLTKKKTPKLQTPHYTTPHYTPLITVVRSLSNLSALAS